MTTPVRVLTVPADHTIPAAIRTIPGTLYGLKDAIGGGWLEPISGRGWSAYCDEEGKIKGLPVNVRATRLARLLGWHTQDILVGPVVFLGPVDNEGDDTDVTNLTIGSATNLGLL